MNYKITYARATPSEAGTSPSDGWSIFDDRIIKALRQKADLEVIDFPRFRHYGLPLWRSGLRDDSIQKYIKAAERGRKIVVSHESLFTILEKQPADLSIVHNYFPAFQFNSQPILQQYYRIGAKNFFARAFTRTRRAWFLSIRDREIAAVHNPLIQSKFLYHPPPPNKIKLMPRRLDFVHVSGSENWLPKRLCKLSTAEKRVLTAAGFSAGDFHEAPSPAFGLITDRFAVGFKLKLAQMIYCSDVIASYVDLAAEVNAYSPGYRYYRHVDSIKDAVAYFSAFKREQQLFEQPLQSTQDSEFCRHDWGSLADELLAELS